VTWLRLDNRDERYVCSNKRNVYYWGVRHPYVWLWERSYHRSSRVGTQPAAKFIFVHYAHVQRYNKESFVSGMHAKYTQRARSYLAMSMRRCSPPCLGFDPSFLYLLDPHRLNLGTGNDRLSFSSHKRFLNTNGRSQVSTRFAIQIDSLRILRIFLRTTEIIKIAHTNKKNNIRCLRENSFSIMYCKVAVRKMNKLYELRKHK